MLSCATSAIVFFLSIGSIHSRCNENTMPLHRRHNTVTIPLIFRGLNPTQRTGPTPLYYFRAAMRSRSAFIFASASFFLAYSVSTTFCGAPLTNRSLESFFITDARNPSR